MFYYPNSRYLVKLMATWFIPFTVINLPLVISANDTGNSANLLALFVIDIVGLGLIFIAALLYYNSLRYEIHEDEIVMTAGVITQSVKHVPFRTITNLTITRGLLDRMLGLGSLQIQTAGASGTTTPEENLVGLDNVEDIYRRVVQELRRFRGGMSPDQAGDDEAWGSAQNTDREVLLAILDELRAIRYDLMQQ